MNLGFFNAIAEETESPIENVVEQVGDLFETAGENATQLLGGLPVFTTKLLIAGLVTFALCIFIRIGRHMIDSIVKKKTSSKVGT